MSVAEGTLTPRFRAEVIGFYGRYFGWSEIESLRLPDRLTLDVGESAYVNIRERPEPMVCSGYEHIGLLLASPESVEASGRNSTVRRSTCTLRNSRSVTIGGAASDFVICSRWPSRCNTGCSPGTDPARVSVMGVAQLPECGRGIATWEMMIDSVRLRRTVR